MGPGRFQLVRLNSPFLDWRFIAGNNRVVAGGALGTEDVVEARRRLADIRDRVPGASTSTYQEQSSRWRWRVTDDGGVLATSSRWYHRRVDCAQTLSQFLARAPGAEIADTVRQVNRAVDLRRLGRPGPVGPVSPSVSRLRGF